MVQLNHDTGGVQSSVPALKTTSKGGNEMASFEKRKQKSIRNENHDPVASLTEEQLLKLRNASGQPGTAYLFGTRIGNAEQQSDPADSGMSPFGSFRDASESDTAFAFYTSVGHPSEGHRPTIVDAVIEHLREVRLRRQRPH